MTEEEDSSIDLDGATGVKRWYIPSIPYECSHCGEESWTPQDQSLYYPHFECEEKIWACCDHCEAENAVIVSLWAQLRIDRVESAEEE